MGRRRSGLDIHGVILLDKPAGISSNQALQKVRHLFKARKAGHTGSLDPFATGMLPLCLGEASKTAGFMLEASKTYRAVAQLGCATDTGDVDGEVIEQAAIPELSVQQIATVLKKFVGPISQVPPMYSALKHKGQPLYKLARQGITIERKAREVTIHRLELLEWNTPYLSFEVHSSKGTYVRTLAEDISSALGSCGHLRSLRRMSVEPFDPNRMLTLQTLEDAVNSGTEQSHLLPIDVGLSTWSSVTLDAESAVRFTHGNPVIVDKTGEFLRVFGPDNLILGLGESGSDGTLRPKRVFVFSSPEN
jgi:tRNA pseudouridine55 synthase